jgi:hypothetical protein
MARLSHPRRAKDSVRKYSNEVWVTNWKVRCFLIINQTAWSARSTFLHHEVLMEAKPLAGRHILLLEDEMMATAPTAIPWPKGWPRAAFRSCLRPATAITLSGLAMPTGRC